MHKFFPSFINIRYRKTAVMRLFVHNSYERGVFMFRYSYEILVNKQNQLDKAFVPRPLVRPAIPFDASADDPKRLLEADAAQAAEELFAYAKAAGLSLWGISGYRPYSRQAEIYRNAADIRYVAPPGASEHQTGLALDVSCPRNSLELTESFASTPEGQWLSKNAHLHGFILRYPREKEKITGYAWEPWHIRYVTKSLSLYLALTGLALEEWVTLHSPIRTRTSP